VSLSSGRRGAILSKVVDIDSVAGTSPDLFNLATVYRANALWWRNLDRIEIGAKADLVLVNLETIHMGPVRDPIMNMVNGATDQDVYRVIIVFRTVVENGKVLGINEHELAKELQRIRNHFIDAIPSRNKQGKTAEHISPLSYNEWDN